MYKVGRYYRLAYKPTSDKFNWRYEFMRGKLKTKSINERKPNS